MVGPVDLIGLDPQKCAQRNRVMALRFGVTAVPLTKAEPVDATLQLGRGWYPKDFDEAVGVINSLKPASSPPVSLDDVYILPPMQAANNSFTPKYFCFLGTSTLRNIQRRAAEGFALMNSHRTGMQLSTPTELPYGRTFAGTYEKYKEGGPGGGPLERAFLWTYMTKGVRPNGADGPSTDDLFRMISTGTLFDVSMGLHGGKPMCDVCGKDSRSNECPHVPSTDRDMSKEDRARQKMRGVPEGLASITVEEMVPNEVSGVFSGAIDGAGFSKGYAYAKAGLLNGRHLAQFESAYAELLSEGDIFMAATNPAGDWDFDRRNADIFVPQPGQVFMPGLEPAPPTASSGVSQVTLKRSGGDDDLVGDDDATTGDVDISDPPTPTPDTEPSPQPPSTPQPAPIQATLYATPEPGVLQARQLEAQLAEANRQKAQLMAILAENQRKEFIRRATDSASDWVKNGHVYAAGYPALAALSFTLINLVENGVVEPITFTDNNGRVLEVNLYEALGLVLEETPVAATQALLKATDLPKDAALLSGSPEPSDDPLTPEDRKELEKERRNGHLQKK